VVNDTTHTRIADISKARRFGRLTKSFVKRGAGHCAKSVSLVSLSLPEDVEPFVESYDELSGPGIYALDLSKPDDLAETWDAEFDSRPAYWDELQAAESVVYVGADKNVMGRLEDHRDKDVRIGVLQRVCAIDGLRNIWFCDSAEQAFERESGKAIELRNWLAPQTYVHQR